MKHVQLQQPGVPLRPPLWTRTRIPARTWTTSLLPVTGAFKTNTSTRSSNESNCLTSGTSVTCTLKVINPANKKDAKNFVLRPFDQIQTQQQLRDEIVKQFGDKVPHTNDFEVGYFRGQQKVWIMTDDDLADAWSILLKGTGSLWTPNQQKEKI